MVPGSGVPLWFVYTSLSSITCVAVVTGSGAGGIGTRYEPLPLPVTLKLNTPFVTASSSLCPAVWDVLRLHFNSAFQYFFYKGAHPKNHQKDSRG